MNLQEIRYGAINFYGLTVTPLETKKLWNHILKQWIGYHEIAYDTCVFIARYRPEYSKEIADLILNYSF